MALPKTFIYALCDPRDGIVRYIGKANNPQNRLAQHLKELRRKSPLYSWIAKLRKLNTIPQLKILCICNLNKWEEVERNEIAKARLINSKLLNLADGGNAPKCPRSVCAENGRRTSALRKSYPESAMTRLWKLKQMMGVSIKHGWVCEDTKIKLRLAAQKYPELFGAWATL